MQYSYLTQLPITIDYSERPIKTFNLFSLLLRHKRRLFQKLDTYDIIPTICVYFIIIITSNAFVFRRHYDYTEF